MSQLNIIYFAWVRELIGCDGEKIERPEAGTTVADIIALLARRGGGYAEALGDQSRVRAALDQHFVPLDTLVGNGSELAIFPPVTGG